ncbi:hypothetical protein NST36_19175 [Bacillus sp. FSL R5-0293]|uniref:hypothetical protein n=1 Tax=Bacillus sp. FSL R5-0293 TaxID=2954584 RepID=UPI0030FA07AA
MKKTNITMIGDLTIYTNGDQRKIEIGEKEANISSLEDLEELEIPTATFLELDSASKELNKYNLYYRIPEGFKSIKEAKNANKVIKLQLIKNFLEIDPLGECNGRTFLDLDNVFYKDYSNFKLMYRSTSDGCLPYDKKSLLDQYKLFIFGLYSEKFSYKKFVANRNDLLVKEDSEFLFSVHAIESFEDLKVLVEKELNSEQFQWYEEVEAASTSKKKKNKKVIYTVVTVVALVVLIMAGLMKQSEKSMAEQYENKEREIKVQQELSAALASKDSDKAIEIMEKNDSSKAEIAQMLVDAGEYDKAISYDKEVEEKVVEKLYKLKKQSDILKLKSNSSFMKTEKDIVRFDVESLESDITFIRNKHSLKRLGIAFLEHDEFALSKEAFDRLASGEESTGLKVNKTEQDEAKSWSEFVDVNEQINQIDGKILALKTKYKGDSEKMKGDTDLEYLENQLMEKQKKLFQLEEKLGKNK